MAKRLKAPVLKKCRPPWGQFRWSWSQHRSQTGARVNTKAKGARNEHRSMQLLEAAGYSVTRAAASLAAKCARCAPRRYRAPNMRANRAGKRSLPTPPARRSIAAHFRPVRNRMCPLRAVWRKGSADHVSGSASVGKALSSIHRLRGDSRGT